MPGGSRARRRRTAVRLLSLAVALGAWQAAGGHGGPLADLLASPVAVVRAGAGLAASGELALHGWASLRALAAGFALGAVAGVGLGLVMGRSRRLRALLDPVVMVFNVTPRIALLPILVVWLGVATASKVAAVCLAAVFPVLINAQAGAQHVEARWIHATRAFGARRWQVVSKVVLPATVPAILAGLRLGLGRAVVTVVVAEMYVALAGMGQLLQLYAHAGRTAEMMAVALLVSGCGGLGVLGLQRLEARLTPWRQDLEP
jgi:ABC-type nitrate/sulfonate/bicarbonate transport system permease component